MRTPNRFTDAQTGKIYDWPLNHESEDGFEKRRTITHGAKTSGTGLVRRQGDDAPFVIKIQGRILTEAMLEEIWAWWELSRARTINWRDFAGDEYEVMFTYFNPTRRRALRNPRDIANAEHHTWAYEMEMEVVRIISGPMAGVSV